MTGWTITGGEGLPIHGVTDVPDDKPRGVAIVVHGFMGTMDRNIIPAISRLLPAMGLVTHRFNLAHCGIEPGADIITRHDEFERDTWRNTHEDINAVRRAIDEGVLEGDGLPLVLIGHSRAGGAVVGYAGRFEGLSSVVSLAGIGWYSIYSADVRAQIAEKGAYEIRSKRAEGGRVRCGPSWFAEHIDGDGRDVFAEDAAKIQCPVLLVHGEADMSVPATQADRVRTIMEGAGRSTCEIVRIPGADHNFNSIGIGTDRENIETPEVRAVADAISGFLDRAI